MTTTAPIAVVAPMREELAGAHRHLSGLHRERAGGRELACGSWQGQPVVVAFSGIGKVAAATTAALLAERMAVRELILVGTAGALAPHVRPGDWVVARSFVQHDMDASPLFPRHEIPLYGRSRFDADPAMSERLERAAQRVAADPLALLGAEAVREFALQRPSVHAGLIASGDQFVSTSERADALREDLPEALAVEMEGAAVAQVCFDLGVRFASVRVISDRAGGDASAHFPRFVRTVASRCGEELVSEYLRAAR